ncbi:methyltransferase, partial [Candidatus Woesearchaeota archaeon]|nr:methyltransferase [Candidatus Woesearchaeota archaeon]
MYEPAEDSFLIQKEVKRLAKGHVLDMGTGSGILAETALQSKKVRSVLGVDVKKSAVEHCRKAIKGKKIKFMVSDLFSRVPKKRFDTIIFNPPYLPEQKGENWELSSNVAGGKHGYEIIERFLSDVNDYLAQDGIIILLFSTITGKPKVDSLIEQYMMDYDSLNKLHLAFEQLHVYKVKKTGFRKMLEKRGVTKIAPLTNGHRGLIYTGRWKNKKITVKVQRQDIGAKGTVDNEIKQLKKLNRHNIGPKLLFSGKDYFAYN